MLDGDKYYRKEKQSRGQTVYVSGTKQKQKL